MKIRILVVDDEKAFVDQISQRLEIREFEVFRAYSGEEALEKAANALYDVIILDVVMPGISGIETLKEMKSKRPLTEVIMLTGHATVETAIEGMKLGAYDYLKKPADIEDLVTKVEGAYNRKKEHEERIRQAKVKEIVSSPRSVLRKIFDDDDAGSS